MKSLTRVISWGLAGIFLFSSLALTALSADSMTDDELMDNIAGKWERVKGDCGFEIMYILKQGILLQDFRDESDFINSYKFKIENGNLVWLDTNLSGEWISWEITAVGDDSGQYTLQLVCKYPWDEDSDAEILTYKRVKAIY